MPPSSCLLQINDFRSITSAEETSSPLVIFLGDLKLATLLYSEQRAEDNDYGASLGCLTHEMSSCYSDSSVAQWLFNRGQTKIYRIE